MRIAVAANTASGGGFDPAPLLAALPGAELFACDDRDGIAAAAPDRIAAAGGDGTIGPLAELAGRLDVALAVIPVGTANDFARAHGLPTDLRAAAELAASGTTTRALELGRLGRETFGDEREQLSGLSFEVGGVFRGVGSSFDS